MNLQILKSKIHKAVITQADLHYEGSLGIDQDIMDMIGLFPYEKILVTNINNGNRIETYAIPAERGSRCFLLNGAAARKGAAGDRIIIMSFASMSPEEARNHTPKVVVLNERNGVEMTKGPVVLP